MSRQYLYHFNPFLNFCIATEMWNLLCLFDCLMLFHTNFELYFNICWKKIKDRLKREMSHRLGLSFVDTLISECNIPTQLMNGWQTKTNKITTRPPINSLCSFTEENVMSVMFICDHTVPHFVKQIPRLEWLNRWVIKVWINTHNSTFTSCHFVSLICFVELSLCQNKCGFYFHFWGTSVSMFIN